MAKKRKVLKRYGKRKRWDSLINKTAMILVLVGALNWGLVQWFNFNFVEWLAIWSWIAPTVYTLVGLSGAWGIWTLVSK